MRVICRSIGQDAEEVRTKAVWDPQDRPQVWGFTGKTHRIWHTVILKAKICHSKRNQSKVSKVERHVGQNPEKTIHKLPRVLSQQSHTGQAEFLQQQVAATGAKWCLPGSS